MEQNDELLVEEEEIALFEWPRTSTARITSPYIPHGSYLGDDNTPSTSRRSSEAAGIAEDKNTTLPDEPPTSTHTIAPPPAITPSSTPTGRSYLYEDDDEFTSSSSKSRMEFPRTLRVGLRRLSEEKEQANTETLSLPDDDNTSSTSKRPFEAVRTVKETDETLLEGLSTSKKTHNHPTSLRATRFHARKYDDYTTGSLEGWINASRAAKIDKPIYEGRLSTPELLSIQGYSRLISCDESAQSSLNELGRCHYLPYKIKRREHGLCCYRRRSSRNGMLTGFEQYFCGLRHVIKNLQILKSFEPGSGVYGEKSFSFHHLKNLLCCTSPQPKGNIVQVWDWQLGRLKEEINGGDVPIYDVKFIAIHDTIVSAREDGNVLLTTITPSGCTTVRVVSEEAIGPCKIALCPQSPFLYLTAGMNGIITTRDIRIKNQECVYPPVRDGTYAAEILSIAYHPLDHELCIGCHDNQIRVYDIRRMDKLVHRMYPKRLEKKNCSFLGCTAMYSYSGSEILGSYSYEDHYLFNNKTYIPGSFLRCYTGHYNKYITPKRGRVAKFFGPNSEYVISSGDSGNICVWNKDKGRKVGIIGSALDQEEIFEPHPFMPILASWKRRPTSQIRIWYPMEKDMSEPLSLVGN